MRNAFVLTCAAMTLAAASVTAQAGVPYSQHIASVHQTNAASSTAPALYLYNRNNNTCTGVSGLRMLRVDAVQLDPIDNTFWLGGRGTGEIKTASLNGSRQVVNETGLRTVMIGASTTAVTGFAFDNNGRTVLTTSTTVERITRRNPGTNPLTNLFTAASGTVNGICTDGNKNVYFGLSGGATSTQPGGIYALQRQAGGTYGAARFLGSVASVSSSLSFSTVEFIPGATGVIAWSTTSAGQAGQFAGTFQLPGGPAGAASAPANIDYNWLEYDVRADDLVGVEKEIGSGTGIFATATKNLAQTATCTTQLTGTNAELTSIDSDDTANGGTTIVPLNPPGSGTFTLELSTTAPPQTTAGIVLFSPTALTITIGNTGPSGRLFVRIPNLTYASGLPTKLLGFASAYVDQGSGRLIIGAPEFWPDN